MSNPGENRVYRVVWSLIGLLIFVHGLLAALTGRLFFTNWKGYVVGPILAPGTIFLGLFLMYLAIFRWRRWQDEARGTKQKSGR